MYSKVATDIKSRELGSAVELLEEAQIISRTFHSSGNGVPISAESNRSKFKVFFVDIGLCNRLLGLRLSQELTLHPDSIVNRGGLAEQFVAQELLALTPSNTLPQLHYWHREEKSSQAEVDFLMEIDQFVLPIEVKSGKSSKMKSLRIFMQEKSVKKAARISSDPLMTGKAIIDVPLYMVDRLSDLILTEPLSERR